MSYPMSEEEQAMMEQKVRQQAEEEGKRLELEGCAAEHIGEAQTLENTEYTRLKEEIIATAAIYTDDIKALTTRLMTIIAERCWLKDEDNELPLLAKDKVTMREVWERGWMPVKEIKKEA